jgi:hypothetical protein
MYFDIHLSGYLQVYFSLPHVLSPFKLSNIDGAAAHSVLEPRTLRKNKPHI